MSLTKKNQHLEKPIPTDQCLYVRQEKVPLSCFCTQRDRIDQERKYLCTVFVSDLMIHLLK